MVESFREVSAVHGRPQRTAAVTAWFQALFERDPPILVGGGAVELYTGGAYTTGDLDFVGRLTERSKKDLQEAGFRSSGRHWIHEKEKLFLEFPATSLGAGERAVDLTFRRWTIRLVSPEDALVDRLAAWKHWRSSVDGVSAFLLWMQQKPVLDEAHLGERAAREHVSDALEELRQFARRHGERLPSDEELRRWAEEQH